MYAFYIPRGHSLSELEKLKPEEKLFYQAAISNYYDDLFTMINTIAISYLGSEKEQKEYIEKMDEKNAQKK